MIYLDYQSTTPLASEAREAILPWLNGEGFGNPSSNHYLGRAAAGVIEHAREQVSSLLPSGGRLIFTASATEAINLAICGLSVDKFAVSQVEHSAVIDTVTNLAKINPEYQSYQLLVDSDGIISADAVISKGTGLVVVQLVNNEIGTIQPVSEIIKTAKKAGALVLCDAAQGYGKIKIPDGVDLVAISAHKIHGPKGIGALWQRDGVNLKPLIRGGGQEWGLRSGTLSPALCAGFGAAGAIAGERMDQDAQHVALLWETARDFLSRWQINGSVTSRWKGNLNLRLDGLDVSRLMSDCRKVMFSTGSACASGSGKMSHVLSAIGLSSGQIKNSFRIGFGRYTTRDELISACKMIEAAARFQGV